MRAQHVGDLIVVQEDPGGRVPVGIITARDIVVAVVAKRASASSVTVGEAMSAALLMLNEDDGIHLAVPARPYRGHHPDGASRANPISAAEHRLRTRRRAVLVSLCRDVAPLSDAHTKREISSLLLGLNRA